MLGDNISFKLETKIMNLMSIFFLWTQTCAVQKASVDVNITYY